MNSDIFSVSSRDLTTSYLRSVFADLERDHHHFYTLLLRSPQKVLTENLIYDYRTEPVRQDTSCDPIRTYCAREFLSRAATFHNNDCFTIGMGEGMIVVGRECDFDTEVIRCIFTEELRQCCRLNLFANKIIDTGAMQGISEPDLSEISKLIDDLNAEIIGDLQFQYDTLKKLDFIKK